MYVLYVCIVACKTGYYGQFCNYPCPPGAFGELCGGRCFPKCTDEDCDHVFGCIKKKTMEIKSGIR